MIRVLRLMEYKYETAEQAEKDMGIWHVPSNGTYTRTPGLVIKSAIITDINFEEDTNDD